MTPKNPPGTKSAKHRGLAEENVTKRAQSAASQASANASRMIHELEVHQVELETQNEELRQARVKLEAAYIELYDHAFTGYFTLDIKGVIQKLNATGATMLGRERSQLIGKRFSDFIAAESHDRYQVFRTHLSAGRGKEGCLVTLMKANKIRGAAYIPLAAFIEATPFEHGCHLVVVDITSSRQAELDRQHSEVTLKIVVAASQLGVWEWDYGAKEIFWSLECWPILGIERLSTLRGFFLGLVHRQDRARVRKLFAPVQEKHEIQSIEYRIIRPDGALAWISSFTHLQFNDDGRPRCVIGTLEEITESKRVEQNASMSC